MGLQLIWMGDLASQEHHLTSVKTTRLAFVTASGVDIGPSPIMVTSDLTWTTTGITAAKRVLKSYQKSSGNKMQQGFSVSKFEAQG